jgi:Cu/Ag efflux pump CusA
MLALLPSAVIGGGGGVGGAFISGPLAIVVIGGLFTSTALTLVPGPCPLFAGGPLRQPALDPGSG